MTIADFEDGFAPAWFNYGEPGILIEPPQAGEAIDDAGMTIKGKNPPQPWWGLQVATLASRPGGERCGSKYALHLEGGRFTSWGGGYVTRHFIVRGEYMTRETPTGQRYCRDDGIGRDDEVNGVGQPPAFMPEGTTLAADATGCMFWASPLFKQPSLLGVDVSDFEGVSFWARRGPSGQAHLRVGLVDDSVSAELALFQERRASKDDIPPDQAGSRCTRVVDCCRHCYEGFEYEEYVPESSPLGNTNAYTRPQTANRCWVEGEPRPEFRTKDDGLIVMWDFRAMCGPVPTTETLSDPCWSQSAQATSEIWDTWNRDYERCCPRTMQEEEEDPIELNGDPRYGGTECIPYVFNFDYSSGTYCHNEGDVLPERNQNRCDEVFEAAVVVSTEWKLFMIPWSELRRFTPDKPPIDPTGIWQVGFYFGSGYLDTYVDDVGFYKRR
jgi:hypothetical protein